MTRISAEGIDWTPDQFIDCHGFRRRDPDEWPDLPDYARIEVLTIHGELRPEAPPCAIDWGSVLAWKPLAGTADICRMCGSDCADLNDDLCYECDRIDWGDN